MGGKGSGRRPKYSADIHVKIIEALKIGGFKRHAAAAAGIEITTLNAWLEYGRAGVEPYVQFAIDVEQAQADDALRNQAIISRAAQGPHAGDWKAAAWSLAKKHPTLYGSAAALKAERMVLRKLEPHRDQVYSPWKDQDPDLLDS